MIFAIIIASIAWFIAAAILFFNPFVDKIYNSQEKHPAVRALPKSPKTIGMIFSAVFVQVVLWAFVFSWIQLALPTDKLIKGSVFGLILVFTKMIPRDIDRLLLTTYPKKRMIIELIIGIICAFIVGIIFGFML